MYGHLQTLRPDLADIQLLELLSPVLEAVVDNLREQYPECTDEYFQFLLERGAGDLEVTRGAFYFESRLLSAELDYFGDQRIYDNGATGDIFIFGWDSMGTAFGFDSGDGWSIKEVDEGRIVTPMKISFKEFVEGLVLCFPQIPMSCDNGVWVDSMGQRYVVKI